MTQFQCFSPDVQVQGRLVLAFMNCLNYKNLEDILRQHGFLGRHGFQTVDPEKWYFLQDWLNVLRDVVATNRGTSMFDFVSIGMEMFNTTEIAKETSAYPLKEALLYWQEYYVNLHRGSDIGSIEITTLGDASIQVAVRTPYPDDLHYGLFYEMARQYTDVDYLVEYDQETPRRDEGGETTIYRIRPR